LLFITIQLDNSKEALQQNTKMKYPSHHKVIEQIR